MAEKRQLSRAEIHAMIVAQIQNGVVMARASGVICGSPVNIRVIEVKDDG